MIRFLLTRSARAVLTLLVVSMATFLMFFLLPRDPVTGMCPKNCNAERLDRVRHELGLDEPILEQYLAYLKGIFVGRDLGSAQGGHCSAPCLGYSYVNNEPVSTTIARVLPVTLSIVIPAAVLWLVLGIGILEPTPDFGRMIQRSLGYLQTDPVYVLIPGSVLFLVVLAFNLFGDAVRESLDPRAARSGAR